MLNDERLESIRGHLACTVNPSLLAARALLDEVDRLRADISVLETLNSAILKEFQEFRVRIATLHDLLERTQWGNTGACPECGRMPESGHHRHCALGAALNSN